jgi:two-component sensor histidine kinase
MPGRILASGEPEWMSHADTDPAFLRGEVARAVGVKAAFGFPLKVAGEVVAVLEFFSAEHAPPDHDLLLTVRTIGEQVGRVLERRRAEERLREEKRALEHEIGERRRVEAHQQLLLGELDHRVKNTLAVVTGMASQTARASRSIEEFRASFLDRLSSLSRAHGLLTAHHWESTALRALAEEILSSYVRAARPQVTITGPELLLAPKEAMAMSMILHELITNATKHGALTTPEGRIEVSWDVGPAAHGAEVTFRWRETGVAGPGRPLRKGFGTKLIEASARMELGGSSSVEWRPDGLEQVINFPAQTRGGA